MKQMNIYYTVRFRCAQDLKIDLSDGIMIHFDDLNCDKNEADVRMRTLRDAAKLCGIEVVIVKHAQYVL